MADDFRPIARAARVIWGLSGMAIITLFALFAGFYTLLIAPSFVVLVIALAVSFGALWWWLSGKRWKAWGYAERENDLVLRRGILVRHETIVPYGRMQFVDTKQGPLERLLNVATVELNTAAAATDARIPMLSKAEAERLRDHLTRLGETHATGL